MKVFVAIGYWDYEGNDDPIGIYSTEELAQQAISLGYYGYHKTIIIEYELDEMPQAALDKLGREIRQARDYTSSGQSGEVK